MTHRARNSSLNEALYREEVVHHSEERDDALWLARRRQKKEARVLDSGRLSLTPAVAAVSRVKVMARSRPSDLGHRHSSTDEL